ncbi:unnamed protein product [Rotaria socialis]|uniref:FERM domain-containing protein n=1 Tax=Rotaria socialis TaxID=392032 RepID=A0A817NKP2_9BILA|nr:unnamed protein product [Rotaria socialis]CAF3533421.1 unnamed protein product [Rotaria socialis]
MDYLQPTTRSFVNPQRRSMNDGDSFDTDRLSGSIQYDDDDDDDQQDPNFSNDMLPPPVADYETEGKTNKKSKKNEEANEKRILRQKEKDEKKARQNEEKERRKSQSRTRTTNERDVNRSSNNESNACIVMLDNSEQFVALKKEDTGKILANRVCDLMNLEERDYFGLKFINNEKNQTWLDNDKRVISQLKDVDPVFYFQVKFYPPEPALLQDDLTRYHMCLQIRSDIVSGKLPCSFVTYALLGSYTAQAEFGDYDEFQHGPSHHYLEHLKFAPVEPDSELLRRIHEQHKRHKGQPPNAADLHFLENAKKIAMYGVDLHLAQDSENVPINIGVSANGLLVYRDKLRINRFAWPKILKISYKKRYFFIKLRPSDFDQYESTIGFKLASYRAAKSLWKIAVEHHAFFRLRKPEEIRKRPILPRFNSTFRYTGKYTYHQARQLTQDRPNPDFERALNKRMAKSLDALSNSTSAGSDLNRPTKSVVVKTLPRPQSIEPFYEKRRIHLSNNDDDEDEYEYPAPIVVKDPEYAYVKKKPEQEPIEQVPVPPPRPPKISEVKPTRPPLPPTYVNVPLQPPVRPREPSPTMDPDAALIAAIRLATDLDPNKEAEQVVMSSN